MVGPMSPRMVQRWQLQRMLINVRSPRRSLLRAAVHAVAEHQDAHTNQNRREKELRDAIPGKPVKTVEQQQNAGADQQDGADRTAFAERVERIRQDLAGPLGLCGTKRVNGHVEVKDADANPDGRLRAAAHRAIHTDDKEHEKNGQMNHAFAVLLVVKGTEAGEKAEEECKYRIRAAGRCRNGGRRRRTVGRLRCELRGGIWWWSGRCGSCESRMAENGGETIFAVQDVLHRPHARGAHRLAAVATVTGGVHLGMNSTLHRMLLPIS